MFFYKYKIYDLLVNINIELPFVQYTDDNCGQNIDIIVKFDFKASEQIHQLINYDNDEHKYVVNFNDGVRYEIYEYIDEIRVTAKSFEHFFSTMFNIPFSVYFALRNKVMLHSSCITNRINTICFTGNKGVGKSTLTCLLCKHFDYTFFSDDTILINDNYKLCKGSDYIKMTDETAKLFGISTKKTQKNLVGKNYVKLENQCLELLPQKNKKIIRLQRIDSRSFFEIVDDEQTKRMIVLSNVVGIQYFPTALIYKVINNHIVEHIISEFEFYNMYIETDLKNVFFNAIDMLNKINMMHR